MTETSVEYGTPPKDELQQREVQKLFGNTWLRLHKIFYNSPKNTEKIEKEIQRLMDNLNILNIELPCQGVEYQGVIVGRDIDIPKETPPAPFSKWGQALGVSSKLFKK